MSYYRYTRLQQYINGQPTDTYTKGERVDNVDYSTYGTCMGSSANTRWVSIPQTVCYNGDLWSMEKEQISYDNRISWVDTGNTRRASIIEQSSSQCFMSEWRVVPGEYICMMYAKWPKEAEYLSYDGGQTWTATGNIRRGETVIELLSTDCGVIYQWIPTGEYMCVGYNKYVKEKQVYSIDNGTTWTDTDNRRPGGLVETDSAYCGYEQYIYQWVDVSGEYICQGYDKYVKQKEQRSSDMGVSWEDTGNTRAGSLIETLSTSCGVLRRWVSTSGYICVDYNKFTKEKEEYSLDNGVTWIDTGSTRAGSIIEGDAEDCGCVQPEGMLAKVTYTDTRVEYIPFECGTKYYGNHGDHDPSAVSLVLYDTVKYVDEHACTRWSSLKYVTIPEGVKILEAACFSRTGLIEVTIPASVTSIGDYGNAGPFANCTSLETATVLSTALEEQTAVGSSPTGTLYSGLYMFTGCTNLKNVTLAQGTPAIAENMFSYCSSLTSLTIPSSVTCIGRGAFTESGLTSLTLPESLQEIGGLTGEGAFQKCYGLNGYDVVLPSNLKKIGTDVFGSVSLSSITCLAEIPPTLSNTFDYNYPIYVPSQSVDIYKAADVWKNMSSRIFPIE